MLPWMMCRDDPATACSGQENAMLAYLTKAGLKMLLYALILLALGIFYWAVLSGRKQSLQDIFFWAGALPIGLFSVAMFGSIFGRGDSSYQMARSVMRKSPHQRGFDDTSEMESTSRSGVLWTGAGLLVWLVSYFM